jgi:hypothetical protein
VEIVIGRELHDPLGRGGQAALAVLLRARRANRSEKTDRQSSGSQQAATSPACRQRAASAPERWTATWEISGDQLAWSDVSIPDFALVWATRPWRKIG